MKKLLINQISNFTTKRNLLIFNIIFISIISSLTVGAQKDSYNIAPDTVSYSWDRFSISFGGFVTKMNSDIQLGSQQVGLGVIINVEDALGLETSSTVLRSEMQYNYGKRRRHTVGLDYFGLLRNAQKVLESEIEIGDEIFPIGTEVDSKFNLQIFKGTYSYSFYQDKRVKLNGLVGLFIMPIKFSTSALGLSEEATSFVAPLPVFGLGTNFAITPKLYIKQSVEFLYLKISNFKGAITDINIQLEYNLWEHFGFGAGLNAYQLDIEAFSDKNTFFNFKGSIKTGYSGLMFYAKYYL